MSGSTPRQALATRPKAEAKAEITDKAARAIIAAETARRDAKTERLRLAREARAAAVESVGDEQVVKQKPSKPRKTRSAR
jgi:hypothetical protein